jgi:hypothetical protein
MIVFQSVFRAEMHQNDVFLFLKNYFWDQHIKTIQNIYKKLIFNKKKLNFKNMSLLAFSGSNIWIQTCRQNATSQQKNKLLQADVHSCY